MARRRGHKERPFPIVEGFGFSVDARTADAERSRRERWCPFAGTVCEKQVQYGYGYCSVTYAAAGDKGEYQTYAVCDHRLDGTPIRTAIQDHFGRGSTDITLVSEVVLTKPRTSFDYVAFSRRGADIDRAIAIEAQAIDIRGGGVGPAWNAWMDGNKEDWREYFSREARQKRRKDTVAYGVNMANIYKRLGMQVATKCRFLRRIGVALYVVMQHRPFEYLQQRIAFEPVEADWDLTFITFEYTGELLPSGQLAFTRRSMVRTTLEKYLDALTGDEAMAKHDRDHFLQRVKRKAGLA